jgi:L-amino acid N-acyltransferase YncA
MVDAASARIIDLEGAARDRAIPILKESFEGIYRWHAKRTLHNISKVRAVEIGGAVVAASLLATLLPEVGYVYYVFVGHEHRRRGLGRELLDDALAGFRAQGVRVVYAAAEEDNLASRKLFETRGFRPVERHEPSWRDGGLGAWGLRSRMMVVHGEVLMGLRLDASASPPEEANAPARGDRAP